MNDTSGAPRPPAAVDIDLGRDPDELVASIHESVARHGAMGFADPSFVQWTRDVAERRPG